MTSKGISTKQVNIREARPEDSPTLIAYVQALAEEPGISIALSPGEFNLTIDEEQQFITEMDNSENSVFLVAEADSQIIGMLTCRGGKRRSTRHTSTLGMSVHKDYRNQAIGSLLMDRAIDWARTTGIISRIELSVFTRNERAIHLYQKFGFEIEGKQRKAIFRDGEYQDVLIMALLL